MSLRQRFQVMRSGSFSDVAGAKSTLEAKRKRWLDRSGSLRLGKSQRFVPGISNSSSNASTVQGVSFSANSPWSSPESERRGSLPIRDRSLDRVQMLERRGSFQPEGDEESGKIKGFVNR